jgi:uncharacterized repeat protein (TIGR01451 family)
MQRIFRSLLRLSFLVSLFLVAPGLPARAVETNPEPDPERPIYAPASLVPASHLPDDLIDLAHDSTPTEALPPGDAATLPVTPFSTSERIAFDSLRDGNLEIYLSSGIGEAGERITWDDHNDMLPRFNPGCTHLVFASDRKKGTFQIFSMNPDGTEVWQMTSKGENTSPDWSPDGARIVFTSYRDDQAEIYLMGYDGTNQTRLTWDGDYDGMPSWSPDGNKVAFISHRTGGYRVYTMNSDGSNLVMLSTQSYSAHPYWSPDGSQIAYDADGDGDGWQELWLMNADGTNQRRVYSPGMYHDSYVSGWSPSGQNITYTWVYWISYEDQWYWDYAYLESWYLDKAYIIPLGGDNTSWDPHWQTTDLLPPTSSMAVLPSQSPSPVRVTWSGSDADGSGIQYYDVQVRDSLEGSWNDWQVETQNTFADYPGIGGHTYYFRARAVDFAAHTEDWPTDYDAVTTIEASPPISHLEPLPAYARNPILLSWSGKDPGNSGIKSYELQYRDGPAGSWIGLNTVMTDTTTEFSGTPGHTYYFRSRATDFAQNVESWPPEDGETYTIIYDWGIYGTVHDNSGVAVSQAIPAVSPTADIANLSDKNGNYAAYVFSEADSFTASITKDRYGELPETVFTNSQDAPWNLIMPPLDNNVQNWGFETGELGTDWQMGGNLPPFISQTARHTGSFGVHLGQATETDFSSSIIVNRQSAYQAPSLVTSMEPDGVLHLVWRDGGLIYTRRKSDGSWSNFTNFPHSVTESPAGLAVDFEHIVHLVWITAGNIYYVNDHGNGIWTDPLSISEQNNNFYYPHIVVDNNGVVHVIWMDTNYAGYGDCAIEYVYRDLTNQWSEPQILGTIFTDICPEITHLILDDNQAIHVLASIYYLRRAPDGAWSSLETILPVTYTTNPKVSQIDVDQSGTAHVIWFDDYSNSLYYTQRPGTGPWSDPEKLSGSNTFSPQLVVSPEGVVYAVWCKNNVLFYGKREVNGSWMLPQSVVRDISCSDVPRVQLALDDIENLHMVLGTNIISYFKMENNGKWSFPDIIPDGSFDPTNNLRLLVEDDGWVHLIWESPPPEYYPSNIYYAAPSIVKQTGDAEISTSISIPVTMTAPTLSYLYDLVGQEVTNGSRLDVNVNDGSHTTTLATYTASTSSWQHGWQDMSAWAGKQITLTFTLHQTAGYAGFNAHLDEITLGSSNPDAWIGVGGTSWALPSETVTYLISYGNHGGAITIESEITFTLPDGLTFVSASLPPTVDGATLTWEVGDLPAHSEPFSLMVTARVDPGTPRLSTLTNTASIAGGPGEIETANNQAQVETFVGARLYLPILLR